MITCTYCNSNLADSRDHVVPKAWSDNYSYADRYVVTACKECNGLLNSSAVHSVPERAAFLYTRYMNRHSAMLKTPDWTATELDDLHPQFRRKIKTMEKKKKLLNTRLLNLRELGKDYLQ